MPRGPRSPGPRAGGTATRRGRWASVGITGHGRQDHDLVPRRRRPGGGGPVDRPDRDGRDQGRPAPRPARRARDHARGARAAGDARGDGPRRQRGGGDRDHVPRASRSTGSWASPGTPPCSPTSPTSTSSSTARSRRTAPPSSSCSSGARADGDATNPRKVVAGRPWPKVAIVNRDDPAASWFEAAAHEAGATRRHLRHGPGGPRPRDVDRGGRPAASRRRTPRRRGRAGSSFAWPAGSTSTTRWRSSRSARRSGLDPAAVRDGLASVEGVPGRMERIDEGQPFAVIVDYAHSPASLQTRPRPPGAARGRAAAAGSSRCSGRPGSGTRPSAPRWAGSPAERCRLVVATDEDPRGEDRDAIVAEIVRGRGGGRRPAGRRRAARSRTGGRRSRRPSSGRVRATWCCSPARATRRRSCTATARSRGTRRRSRARRSRRWATGGAERCADACSRCSSARSAIAVFVVIGLPAIAAGAITAGVTAAGLQSDDTVVTVSSDPPTDLLGLHADRVRVRATDATFRGLEIASLDLTLHDLHLVDRTAAFDRRPHGRGRRARRRRPRADPGHDRHRGQRRDRHGHGDHPRRGGGGDDRRPRSRTPSAPARPTSGSRHPTGSRSQLVIAVKGRFVVSDTGDLLVRITNGPAAGQTVTVLRGGERHPAPADRGDGDRERRPRAHRRPRREPPGLSVRERGRTGPPRGPGVDSAHG